MAPRSPERVKYRLRIRSLIQNPPQGGSGTVSDIETSAHWAKYVCVLVSGFIEQAVKEVLIEHAVLSSAPRIANYVEKSWPISKNMFCQSIHDIVAQFDAKWSDDFDEWVKVGERKKEINEIVSWRNNIAHGKESSTNNVTIGSVSTKFVAACELVDFLETLSA